MSGPVRPAPTFNEMLETMRRQMRERGLTVIETGSNCCGAHVREGVCQDCREYCEEENVWPEMPERRDTVRCATCDVVMRQGGTGVKLDLCWTCQNREN